MKTSMFRKQSIKAFKRAARPVYYCHWYECRQASGQGKQLTACLGTRDETQAKAHCIDLEILCNTPEVWGLDPNDSRITGLSSKARQIFFGLEAPPEAGEFRALVDLSTVDAKSSFGGATMADGGPRRARVVNVVVPAGGKMRDDKINAELEAKVLRKKLEQAEEAIAEYRQRLNEGCTETLAAAVEKYSAKYASDHRDKHTAGQVSRILKALSEKLGGETLVGKVEGNAISDFVDGLKNAKTGQPLEANTKRKNQAYISAFFSWAVREYRLFSDPMNHAHPVTGAGKKGEVIAITDYSHSVALLEALKPHPYWRAWVAFATLAGPRWSEQANAKLSDLAPDFSSIKLEGEKTDTWRRTPIEQNVLKLILKEYVETVRPAGDSPLLFPSLVGKGHGSRDDVWKSSTFHKWWAGGWNPVNKGGKMIWKGTKVQGVSEKIVANAGDSVLPCFGYGPDEWRHCGATAMGHAGVGSLRISQWVGNSEDMCRTHYIAMTGTEPWPLKYLGVAE